MTLSAALAAAVTLGLLGCGSGGLRSPDSPEASRSNSDHSNQALALQGEPRESRPDDWFEDATASAGIRFQSETGRQAGQFTILETVGSGIGLVDFDLDARADLFAVGGGTIHAETAVPAGAPCGLFRSLGRMRFAAVTVPAAVPRDTDYSHGIQAGDFNEDGFPDLVVTCYGRCVLLLNQGDGTFADVAPQVGLGATGWHTASAWGDFDQDGDLDLFITRYVDWRPDPHEQCPSRNDGQRDVCPPQRYGPVSDLLYLNQGDGTFLDQSSAAGIRNDGKGLGVLAADFNGDTVTDLYVANDVVANHLYFGGREFPLKERGETTGLAYNAAGTPEGSMGVDFEDIDGDSLPDLFVTNFELEDNSLFRNLGNGQFQHATTRTGLAGVGRGQVGFGTGFHDFDADGHPDLYILNGHVLYRSAIGPFRQPAFLLGNRGDGRFVDVSAQGGPWFGILHAARGGAVADLDDNGTLDLVVSSLDEPVAILRNRRPEPMRWLRVHLIGTASPRSAIGARITVLISDGGQTRILKSGSGYLSQSDPRIPYYFPKESDTAELQVVWPSGRTESFRLPVSNGDVMLVEGTGSAT